MSINGKVQDGSMEIDAGNNLETFKTGSGSEEAVEVHDFQIVSISTLVFHVTRSSAGLPRDTLLCLDFSGPVGLGFQPPSIHTSIKALPACFHSWPGSFLQNQV